MILIGNKIDLVDKRKVTFDEGQEFAINQGIIFMETSAKTGDGVEEIFKKSAQEIKKRIGENYYDLNSETCGIKKGKNNSVNLNNEKSKDRRGCC